MKKLQSGSVPDPLRPETAPGAPEPVSQVDARALMRGAREIVLTLDGEPYRLRITAKQKLILTK